MSELTGASAQQLARFGRRYAGAVRVATALPIRTISVLGGSAGAHNDPWHVVLAGVVQVTE